MGSYVIKIWTSKNMKKKEEIIGCLVQTAIMNIECLTYLEFVEFLY